MVLSHPVLIMEDHKGSWVGLDGCARVEFARKMGLPCLPAIVVAEANVRQMGKFNLELPFEEEVSRAEKGAYRAAMLSCQVYAHRVASRPWMKDPARQTEKAFGAGSKDGARLGRPYLHMRPEPRITKGVGPAGRKSLTNVEKIECAIGRVLSVIRNELKASGHRLRLLDIVEQLKEGRIRPSLASKDVYPLILGLPNIRDLESLVTQPSNGEIFAAGQPKAVVIENVEPHYTNHAMLGRIFLLRDLGVLRLRIQEFNQARNGLIYDAGRDEIVSTQNYDRMLFDRSSRPNFQALPQYLSIPGLIDPIAVAQETGVLACQYYADNLLTLPMYQVASIMGQMARNINPIVDLGTAISYLQYRARSQYCAQDGKNITGPIDSFWLLAIRNEVEAANYPDFAALAAARAGAPVLLLEAVKAEVARAKAA